MNGRGNIWQLLGIAPTGDVGAIRRAYATRLKALDPDSDPEGFMALRQARDHALDLARQGMIHAGEAPEAPSDAVPDAEAPSPLAATNPFVPPRIEGAPEGTIAVDPVIETGPYRITDPDLLRQDAATLPPPARLAATGDAFATPRMEGREGQGAVRAFARSEDPRAAIVAILNRDRGGNARLAVEEEAALLDHFRAAVADPRMQQLDFYGDSERWFAAVIFEMRPVADILLEPAIEFFGWAARSAQLDSSPAIPALLQYREELLFIERVRERGHPLRLAFAELSTTRASKGVVGSRATADKVHDLLDIVRRDYPGVERYFDPQRVARWEQKLYKRAVNGGGGGNGTPGWAGSAGMVVLFLVSILSHVFSDRTTPVPTVPAPAVVMPTDLASVRDDALRAYGGDDFTYPALKTANPRLASLLDTNLKMAQENGTSDRTFIGSIMAMLDANFDNARHRADYQLMAGYQRARTKIAAAIKRSDPALCDRYFEGSIGVAPVSRALLEEERNWRIRILLATDGSLPARPFPTQFMVPGKVVDTIGKQLKLERLALEAALQDKGPTGTKCALEIALRDAVLALPVKEALPLLHAM